MDDSRVFTKSERILLDYQKLKRMSAADLKGLIQQVLKNPEFNIDEVDHEMHERLQRAIDNGDIDVTDFWQKGDAVTAASKMLNSLAEKSKRSCESCCQTNDWQVVSTLVSKSIRIPMVTGKKHFLCTFVSK